MTRPHPVGIPGLRIDNSDLDGLLQYATVQVSKHEGEYEILFDCPGGRWKAGDRGFAVPNDFEKYDVKLITQRGIFYFHANEVRRIP